MSLLKYFKEAPQPVSEEEKEKEEEREEEEEEEEENLHSSVSRSFFPCSSSEECLSAPAPKQARVSCEEACPEDVANAGTNMSDAGKYQLLISHFKPGPDYRFPRGVHGRSFQYRWLQVFPWLVYSKQANGGFCLPCVLFATDGYNQSTPGVLVHRPLVAFAKALELFRKHAEKDYHKAAVVRADDFIKVMKNQQPGIAHQIIEVVASRVSINRQILASIVKTIVFCGQQNIALRGHRDNATDLEKALYPENHGNFRALLQFRIDAGDSILGEHFATACRNATYTSSNIQTHPAATHSWCPSKG